MAKIRRYLLLLRAMLSSPDCDDIAYRYPAPKGLKQ